MTNKVIRVMYTQRLRSKGEMDWRRRDCEVQVIPNLCEMIPARLWYHHHWLSPPRTPSGTGLRPLIQRVPRAPPDVASSRLWWQGLCAALECVCVMSEAWPGLWNIIYLVAPGFTLMVCSNVAVVKITIVNWMKYQGRDMHMMLRERERVRDWITQSACVRACRVWLLRDCMHVCVSEGCPLLLVTKQQHRTARTEVFPDTWQLLASLPGFWPKHFVIEGKDEGSRRARKSFTEGIHHTFGSSLLLSLLFVDEVKAVRRDCERGL